jgi:hypothetical protein
MNKKEYQSPSMKVMKVSEPLLSAGSLTEPAKGAVIEDNGGEAGAKRSFGFSESPIWGSKSE